MQNNTKKKKKKIEKCPRKIDVCVFHCCALAVPPWRIKQSLQQRMDDWKQRVKIVLDQIYAVDPYYVQSNETRVVNQISYADIAAGRTSPSSRGSSPFRNPRDEVPSVPLSIQVLKPTVQLSRTVEAQKQPAIEPTGDNTPPNAAIAETKMKEEQSRPEEQNEQKEPEVRTEVRRRVSKVDSVDSRLRNQSRRSGSVRKDVRGSIRESLERNSSAEADNEISGSDTPRSVVEQRREPFVLKNTLAPKVERRGRSASPIWMPGSTSYADILRGNRQNSRSPSVETSKDAHVVGREVGETVVEESSVETVQTETMEFEVPKVEVKEGATAENAFMEQPSEDVAVESYQQQPAEVVHEVVPEVESPVKTSEEPSETQTSWADESIDEYVLLNEKSYENVARPPVATQQVPEVYNYIHPAIPELVGFIGSQIAYPVSSYVYMPAAPPQQMALPHYTESQIAFPSEPYVAQPSYIPEPEIYQQNQLQKHPQRHPHQTKFKIPPKTTPVVVQNVEEKCLPSRAQKPVDVEPVVQSNIQATVQPAVQPAVQAEEVSEPEKPVEPEQFMQQTIEQPVQQVATPVAESTPIKTKSTISSESKTFSYAQILSQGLSSKPTSTTNSQSSTTNSQSSTTTTLISKQAKERSRSPVNSATSSVHESSPPQDARQTRESTVSKPGSTWDISRRRETRKTHQESPKTKIPEKRARRGPEQPKASEVFQKPQKEKIRTNTEQQKQAFEFKDEITVEDLTASPKVTPKSVKVEIRKEQVDDVKPEKKIDAEETKKTEDHKQDEKDVQEEKEVDVQQRSRSQEKKRKAKKKKPEKVDDEIEKALKEIEDMDKHKKRDKSREQAKKDTVQATVEKSKEESEKKNVKSNEKKKQGKSKMEKIKDESETAVSQSNAKEQVKSKDDAKENKEEKDSGKRTAKDDVKASEEKATKVESRKNEAEKRSEVKIDSSETKKVDAKEEKPWKKKQKGKEQAGAAKDKSNKDTKPTKVDAGPEQIKKTTDEDKVESPKQKHVKPDSVESVQNLEQIKKEDTKATKPVKSDKTPETKVESKNKVQSEPKEKEPMKEQEKSKKNKKQKQGNEQETSKVQTPKKQSQQKEEKKVEQSKQKKSEEKSEVTKDVKLDEKEEVEAEVNVKIPKDDKDKKVAEKEKGKKDDTKEQKKEDTVSEVEPKADIKEEQKTVISALIRVIESTMEISEGDESKPETMVQENVDEKSKNKREKKQNKSGEEQIVESKDSKKESKPDSVQKEEPKKVVELEKQTKSKGKKSKKEPDVSQKLAPEAIKMTEKEEKKVIDKQVIEEKSIKEGETVTEQTKKELKTESVTPSKGQSDKKRRKKSKSPTKAKKEEDSKSALPVEEKEKPKENEVVEAAKLEEKGGKIDNDGKLISVEETRITGVEEKITAIQTENQKEDNIVNVTEKVEAQPNIEKSITGEKSAECAEIFIDKKAEETVKKPDEPEKVETSDVKKKEGILLPEVPKPDKPEIQEVPGTPSKSKKGKSKEKAVTENTTPISAVEPKEESKSSQPSTPKSDKRKKKKQENKDKIVVEPPQLEQTIVTEKPSTDMKPIEESEKSVETPSLKLVTPLIESQDKKQSHVKKPIEIEKISVTKSDDSESRSQELIENPSTEEDSLLSKNEKTVNVLATVSPTTESSSLEKSSLVEKAVTTVTSSAPEPVEAKPSTEKIVENLESIPSSKVVGSKPTELITLRPETVESSLTTTEYARVSDDSAVGIPWKALDTLADVDKSISDYTVYLDDLVKDDQPILFGSVQDRRRGRSGTPKSVGSARDERELDNFEKEQDAKVLQDKSKHEVEGKKDRMRVEEEVKIVGEAASVESKDSGELVVESEGEIVQEKGRMGTGPEGSSSDVEQKQGKETGMMSLELELDIREVSILPTHVRHMTPGTKYIPELVTVPVDAPKAETENIEDKTSAVEKKVGDVEEREVDDSKPRMKEVKEKAPLLEEKIVDSEKQEVSIKDEPDSKPEKQKVEDKPNQTKTQVADSKKQVEVSVKGEDSKLEKKKVEDKPSKIKTQVAQSKKQVEVSVKGEDTKPEKQKVQDKPSQIETQVEESKKQVDVSVKGEDSKPEKQKVEDKPSQIKTQVADSKKQVEVSVKGEDPELEMQKVEDKPSKIEIQVEESKKQVEVPVKDKDSKPEKQKIENEARQIKTQIAESIKQVEVPTKVKEPKPITKEIYPCYFTDLVKPYWFNYRPYIEAEINFHRCFKVVEVIEENVPASATPRLESIERIAQESIMKEPKEEEERPEDTEQSEAESRKLSLIRETLKYPISTFYRVESEWVKSKQAKEKEIMATPLEESNLTNVEVVKEAMQIQEDKKHSEILDAPNISENVIDKEKTIAEITTEIKSTDMILDQTAALIEDVNKELDMMKKEKEQSTTEGKVEDKEEEKEPEVRKKEQEVSDKKPNEKSKKEKQPKDEKSKSEKEEKKEVTSPVKEPEVVEKNDITELTKAVEQLTMIINEETKEASLAFTQSEEVEKKDIAIVQETELAQTTEQLVTKIDEPSVVQIIDRKEEEKIEKNITEEEPLITLEPKIEEVVKPAIESSEVETMKEETKLEKDKKEHEKLNEKKEIVPEPQILIEEKIEKESEKVEKPVSGKKKVSKEPKKKDVKEITREEKLSTEEKALSQESISVVTESATTEKSMNGKVPEIKDSNAPESPVIESKTKPSDKPRKEEGRTKSGKQKQPKEKSDIKATSTPEKDAKKQEEQEISSPDSKKKRDGKSKKANDIPEVVPQETPTVAPLEETKKEKSQSQIKEISKEEIQPVCAKSWASVVGMKGTSDLPAENVQTMTVIPQESISGTAELGKVTQIVETVPEEPQSPQTQHKKHQKKKDMKQEKIITEAKVSSIDTETEKENMKSVIPEKVEELELSMKDSNKSYAQVAASSKGTSPQSNQEDVVILKPIPLMPDQSLDKLIEDETITSEKSLIITETPEAEKETSKPEEITTDKKLNKLITEQDVFKMESISWAEEIEKEAMVEKISSMSPIPSTVVVETPQKMKDSWATIVSKHAEPLEPHSSPTSEKIMMKKQQTAEHNLNPQIQIHVEEAPEPVSIEEVVKIDEQGFMEFVNRKELRSRRSRSRSRSIRRDEANSRQSSDKPIVPEEILAEEQKQMGAQKVEEQKKKDGNKGKEGKSKKKRVEAKSSSADRNQVTKDEQEKDRENLQKEKDKEKTSKIEEKDVKKMEKEIIEPLVEEKIQKQPEKKGTEQHEDKSKTKEVNLSQESKEKAGEKVEEKLDEEVKEVEVVKPETPEVDKIIEMDKQNSKSADKWKKAETKEQSTAASKKSKKSKRGKSDKEQPKEELEHKEQIKEPGVVRVTEIQLKSEDEVVKEPETKEITEIQEVSVIAKSEAESKPEIVEEIKSEKSMSPRKRKGKSKEKKVETVSVISETSIEGKKVPESKIKEEIPAKEPEVQEIKEVEEEVKITEPEKSTPTERHKEKSEEKKVETVPERIIETSVDEKKVPELEIKEMSVEKVKEEVKESEASQKKEIDSKLDVTEEKREVSAKEVTEEKHKEEPIKPPQTPVAEMIVDTKTETADVKDEAHADKKLKLSKKEKRRQKKKEKSTTRATSEEKLEKETSETFVPENEEETITLEEIKPDEVKSDEVKPEEVTISPDETNQEKELNEKLQETKKLSAIIPEVIPDEIKLVPETMLKPIIKEKTKPSKEEAKLLKPTEEKEKVSGEVENFAEDKMEIPKLVTDKSETPKPEIDKSEVPKPETDNAETFKPDKIETPEPVTDEAEKDIKQKEELTSASKEKSKRKNKQAKKGRREEQEAATKSMDEELQSPKDEKEIEILGTGSTIPSTPETPKETVDQEKDATIPEEKIESGAQLNKLEIDEPRIEEVKKDEKEAKVVLEEQVVLKETVMQEKTEISAKGQEEVDRLQKTEEIPEAQLLEKKPTKEEKSKTKKIKDKIQEETTKNVEEKISEEEPVISKEEIPDKVSEVKTDKVVPLEAKPEETIKPAEIIVNGKLTEENDKTEKEITEKKTEEIEKAQSGIVKELESIIQETDQLPQRDISTEKLLHKIESPITIESMQSQLETEEEFEKCISSEPEIETVDIVVEPVKPKVQFYIADEILVLSPEKKKPVQTPLILKTLSELSRSKFLSLDSGFWPDKHPYHEAERYLFENLANYPMESLSDDIKRDSNDKDDFDGDQGGGNLNERGGNGGPLNSYFMGGPHTERLIADLPGGIGSWSDYSTYLSSENEQRTDQSTEVVQEKIENPMSDLINPSDNLLSELSSVHLKDDQSISKFDELSLECDVPTTSENSEDVKLLSLSTVEVSASGEQPLKLDYKTVSPDQLSESTYSDPRELSSTPGIPDHDPDPKKHLGRENGSMQRRTPIVETEREMGVTEDEAEKRIRGIKVRSQYKLCSIITQSSLNEFIMFLVVLVTVVLCELACGYIYYM